VPVLASTTVAEVLLVLKIAFLVLLYLFVIRVIRSAGRGQRAAPSQDSMILSPQAAAAAGLGRGGAASRTFLLVVQRSPSLEEGDRFPVNSAPVTVGRGGQNDLVLNGDDFASARHARIEARGDGLWVQDLESTNGTFVNGSRVAGAQRLDPGDVLRVGETDLRVEAA
jgi:pSer/pThr/pTyr-binding forkhead associated (FHA) protein